MNERTNENDDKSKARQLLLRILFVLEKLFTIFESNDTRKDIRDFKRKSIFNVVFSFDHSIVF